MQAVIRNRVITIISRKGKKKHSSTTSGRARPTRSTRWRRRGVNKKTVFEIHFNEIKTLNSKGI